MYLPQFKKVTQEFCRSKIMIIKILIYLGIALFLLCSAAVPFVIMYFYEEKQNGRRCEPNQTGDEQ